MSTGPKARSVPPTSSATPSKSCALLSLGDQSVGDRLTSVALLHADREPAKIGGRAHIGTALGVHDQRLSRDDIGIAEIGEPSPLRRDGGSRSDAASEAPDSSPAKMPLKSEPS